MLVDVRADRVEQVRLAEPGRAVDEKRVVRATRCLGDTLRRSKGELVRRTLDERVEGVARIQTDGLSTSRPCRQARDRGVVARGDDRLR